MAEEILLPVDRVRAVLKMAQQPISLQAPVGESEETNFGDFIEDKGAENPSDMTAIALLKEKIKDVLETLTDRERQVLEQRFGLVDGYSRTLEEVGRQFRVTRERIRQIEAKALRKMRHPTRIRQLEGFLEAADLQTVPKAPSPCRLTRAVVDNTVPVAVDHHRSRINDRTAIEHRGIAIRYVSIGVIRISVGVGVISGVRIAAGIPVTDRETDTDTDTHPGFRFRRGSESECARDGRDQKKLLPVHLLTSFPINNVN